MNTKNILLTTTMMLFAMFSFATLHNFETFAEEEDTGYKMVENVKSVMTFTFRDGVEIHEFPYYSMTTDLISNTGLTFQVQGVIGDSPYLHKAIDELYKNRFMISNTANFEYDYRYFDVNIDFLRDDQIFHSISYDDCQVSDYQAKTLTSNDYESYTSKSGFALIDEIDFKCAGLDTNSPSVSTDNKIISDYTSEPLDYTFAEDVRTYVTFDYDTGMEKVEFHGFEIDSGFASGSGAGPSFSVEYVLNHYPLLENAIDNSRELFGTTSVSNIDFDAKVEFGNTERILRELNYFDCTVSSSEIVTLSDKEEGFTGKSGFALVQQVGFTCAGFSSENSIHDSIAWQPVQDYNLGTGGITQATFTYSDGMEIITFPVFTQNNVLDISYPSFTLEGIVGEYPMLYEKIDEQLSIQSDTGNGNLILFDVDTAIINGGDVVREYNYSGCRLTDYDVGSDMNKEESYIKGKFALENTFDIECKGYKPNNPAYDKMFETVFTDSISTNDLRVTDSWGPQFRARE